MAHTYRGSQYVSIRCTERLAEADIAASVGTVGDSVDNGLAETVNGAVQTELSKARGPWRTPDAVEIATAEWVDWFNHRRLYEYCCDIRPAEVEDRYYAHHEARPTAELQTSKPPDLPGRFTTDKPSRVFEVGSATLRHHPDNKPGVHPGGVQGQASATWADGALTCQNAV